MYKYLAPKTTELEGEQCVEEVEVEGEFKVEVEVEVVVVVAVFLSWVRLRARRYALLCFVF